MTGSNVAYDRIIGALEARGSTVRVNGTRAMAQCPAHEDRTPSLSLTPIEGQVLANCFAGCDIDDVLGELGLHKRDLYDNRRARPTRTRTRSGARPASWTAAPTRNSVRPAPTSPMGAKSWGRVDTSPLDGAHVVVVPDKDDAGRKYLTDVLTSLQGTTASIRVMHAKVGKDAADHVAAGHGLDDLQPVDIAPAVAGVGRRRRWPRTGSTSRSPRECASGRRWMPTPPPRA
ncbi:MAG: hypothetical protein WKH47_00880 [Actinomycetes bacterium]